MVTYRNRDPEPSVRFRPPHPVLKVLAVLFCCVQLLAVPAFAVDDTEWVEPDFNFTIATYGANDFTIYGTETRYVLDDNGMGLFDYSRNVNEVASISSDTRALNNYMPNRWEFNTARKAGDAPYSHYESDQSTYYTLFDYNQVSFKSSSVWFDTDLEIEPGFYEFDVSFIIDQYLRLGGTSYYFRPVAFEVAISNGGRLTYIAQNSLDSAKFTCEVVQGGTLVLAASTSTQLVSYNITQSGRSYPDLRYVLALNHFRYRTIDSLDVTALNDANTNAGNTITDYDNVEQQWTGSMSDNFAQLNLGNFSFGDGLISGFGLVSDLFMRVWTALGSYAIVYTFPLYLGIVLVLMGRVNRFIGHLDRKGDNDA